MNKRKLMVLLVSALMMTSAHAIDLLGYMTDEHGVYQGPTVEEKVAEMDTDNNGFADVYEVRAYLAKKHGDAYQKSILDRWEFNANPNSCGTTSFVESFVVNN